MDFLFKVSIYFLSYFIVWISVIFIDLKSIFIDKNFTTITEWISLGCIFLLTVISWKIVSWFSKSTTKSQLRTYQIDRAAEKKDISVEFILSTALPMISFDFTIWSQVILFLIFFISIGILSIRHNIFWINIYFEIKGYRVFDTMLLNNENKKFRTLIISKQYLPNFIGKDINLKAINNQYYIHIILPSDKNS